MILFQNENYGVIEIDCNNTIKITANNPNIDDTDGIRLTVVKISNCSNINELNLFGVNSKFYDTLIYENIILENTTKCFKLNEDGIFFFRIRDYYSENEETFSFISNNILIKSVIEKTKKVFCSCGNCNTLQNIFKKDFKNEVSLILDYIILFSLLEECYNIKCLNCQFEELTNCNYLLTNFQNKEENIEYKYNLILGNLFNQLNKFLIDSNLQQCFINDINNIFKCIKKKNILMLDCVEESLCKEYMWDLTEEPLDSTASLKYTKCNETIESSINGLIRDIGTTILLCVNPDAIPPTANIGTISITNNNC